MKAIWYLAIDTEAGSSTNTFESTVIFQLPGNHGNWRFKYEVKTVIKFRDALWNLLYESFGIPDNRVGLYMRPHPQCKDDREPEFHFHVIQSKHLFKWEDRHFMDEFNNLPVDDKPLYSLYLLHQAISTEPEELASIEEEKWRGVVSAQTGLKVSGNHPPLVKVTSRVLQNDTDRRKIAKYIGNPALHAFRNIWLKKDSLRKGFVLLIYGKKAGGGESRIVSMPVTKFTRRYLLLPNKKLPIHWSPRGPLRCSKFQPILDEARRLRAGHRGEMVPLLNFPIARIRTKAEVFREYYESQGPAGVEHLRAQYQILPRPANPPQI